MYKLIRMRADYADEFDCEAFAVMSEAAWMSTVDRARAYDREKEISFGTNEAVVFNGFAEWFRCMSVTDISDEEAFALDRLFGGRSNLSMHENLGGKISVLFGTGKHCITGYNSGHR